VLVPFTNEPFTDFSIPENKAAFEAALAKVREEIGGSHKLYIDGEWCESGQTFESTNPSNTSEVLGTFAKAGIPEAERALEVAERTFKTWSKVGARQRAGYLLNAASQMRARKHEFSAVMVLEVGKTWAEADGDTAESIDFLEFYAREALRLAEEQPLTPVPGEWNQLVYIPLGVCSIIPPWNFPNAIMAGMTTAAIVSGNTVVMKPASDSPWIATKFVELMVNVGLPAGVLNFVPGGGSTVGETMVNSPKTRLIAFTGSKPVGLGIHAKAATPHPDCMWIKRTVLEMGGKDAMLIDRDVDLDYAADEIVKAAFGFQGQKCSACSRAILHDDIYDELAAKIVERTAKLVVGDPQDPGTDVAAVINEAAFKDIVNYIEIGKTEGKLLHGGGSQSDKGWFVQPTVIGDLAPEARVHCEEIFGPVLALLRCKDFDDGLRIVNSTEFGLTGGVITRDRANLEKARREFHAGNLYLNRKCTGALVGGHPFGGFNMSGTDSKAGGRDYLLLFTQAKSITERL
jgi:1-pyrroline-5-carboxylate dehydrogenase